MWRPYDIQMSILCTFNLCHAPTGKCPLGRETCLAQYQFRINKTQQFSLENIKGTFFHFPGNNKRNFTFEFVSDITSKQQIVQEKLDNRET